MLSDLELAALETAWAPARSAGVLGGATIQELWEHTAGYTSAVCSHFSAEPSALRLRLIDVGTGAGVPGLLLAHQLPQCHVVLMDTLDRRLDHVRRARRALGLESRTEVVHARAEELGRASATRGAFDAAVARLLAEPAETVELLAPLVRDGGALIVSTAPRWQTTWEALPVPGLPLLEAKVDGTSDRFVTIPRRGPIPDQLPRREKARRRTPLLPG